MPDAARAVATGVTAVVGTALFVVLINFTDKPVDIVAFAGGAVLLGFLVGRWWILAAGLSPFSGLVLAPFDGFPTPYGEILAYILVGYIPIATICIAAGVLVRLYLPRVPTLNRRGGS